jgi:hypothetical protein
MNDGIFSERIPSARGEFSGALTMKTPVASATLIKTLFCILFRVRSVSAPDMNTSPAGFFPDGIYIALPSTETLSNSHANIYSGGSGIIIHPSSAWCSAPVMPRLIFPGESLKVTY